ncbi:MAG: NUDIX domain-containing protein [Lactobacillaceae bacterium]|jgi:NADH pyrophosphatase NudC (nudix superfamily)|nr:NUDIX domain-containing protein [Lactobacillaceae bacterium]
MPHPLDAFKYCPKCGSDKFGIKSPIAKKCGNCGFEFYKNPAIGAGPIIVDEKGRLLTIRRAKEPGKNMLGLPGGFVDIKETIEEALIRETKEEINVDIEVEKYLFSIPNSYLYQSVNSYPLDFFFKCGIKDMSRMKIDINEVLEVIFIEKDKINPDDFGLPSNKTAIKKLLDENLI